jgi:myosin heavy subunit
VIDSLPLMMSCRYIGPVIVSVNPYEKIDKLYSDETIKSYKGKEIYEVQPHVYARK